ncbi:Beta-barrel assembly machine subunit BamD [Roseivirga pacifica]|uniref:Beta-barrel assembly machine subunit BamD n=1 Tax=Roseivirga pacifica TaxID=1267423 RepID=A0A1I0QWZ4_9BACT|nr:outer membrane protein assembly factor BamD [Roseivirga pacifica]MCO6357252.1 outer membrane protein assembly factor BamD [Roseivirga pacifica]MCO6368034.1 outer membrane protein assembly factor BamD [Roseivirga pacifica]MCO6369484.1 outer membrane protein assembly factor BamD [Roseivirga pacifica]MCO6373338.1 outer membrane protein assembly factor BamD [Roseivirga pacifica]MCO6377405.1 outer membrane protein assembly factor BamD [Roseivirga pacifica]
MKKTALFFLLIALIGLNFSCTTRISKLERTNDFEELYEAAIAYYEQGRYDKAKLYFERIQPYYRGALEGEKIRYYWAYCEYYNGFYQLAAFQFKEFYRTYGRSPFAEEAQFMEAYSLFQDSPDSELDQSSSEEAVVAMQNFLNRYPASHYYERANTMIDELQVRFEKKAYETAKLYHRLSDGLSYRNYLDAALVTFETFKEDYPDSDYNEELLYLSIETSYKLAENSITSKKKERFDKTLELYREFSLKFPESEYMAKATDFQERSIEELNRLKNID